MTLGELRTALRARLDDVNQPYLWTDTELNSFLNQAVNEACFRARLIVDSTSSGVTSIAVTPGVYEYPIHKSVFYIDRAYDSTVKRELLKTGHDEVDEKKLAWPNESGAPMRFMLDLNYYHVSGDDEHTHKLTLYPTPTEATTLKLTVYRLPLEEMTADGDVPELPTQFHADLLHWACHLAFLKRDSDTANQGLAQQYFELAAQAFGPRQDAWMLEHRRKKYARRVIPRWV